MSRIPLILHQIWLDKNTDDNQHPPTKYLDLKYTLGIARINPDFGYRFWNMKAAKELFRNPRLRRWKEFYFKLDDFIEQCDFLRYAILFIHGGIYIDCDLTAVRPLKTLVDRFDELMLVPNLTQCNVTLRHNQMTKPAAISNSFMGSVPHHHFWSELMDYIMYRYNKSIPVLYSTGPVVIGNFTQLMYFSIDDRPEWYVNNRLILWEKVPVPQRQRFVIPSEVPETNRFCEDRDRRAGSPDLRDVDGQECPYLHNNRFMGSWWQLSPKMLAKTSLYALGSSVTTLIIWIIVTMVLIFLILIYYPPTKLGGLLESSIQMYWNSGSSKKLWLMIAGGALILGIGLILAGVKCAKKIYNQAEQWDLLVNIGMAVIAISLILGSRSILRFK